MEEFQEEQEQEAWSEDSNDSGNIGNTEFRRKVGKAGSGNNMITTQVTGGESSFRAEEVATPTPRRLKPTPSVRAAPQVSKTHQPTEASSHTNA
ncbi:hypothetical protein PIB30_073949 [Stylosanthes scabra]|uniref:Uncharacterized protein n=1 Tax=Stylosanthes scabra TaxID=79078 RepID=A0ABU6WMS9_9FABA|nr:hypothetical protein [Stylosanthes scabra]